MVSAHTGCTVYITIRMIRSQSVQIPDTSQIVSMKFLVSLFTSPFTIWTSPSPKSKSLKIESEKRKRNLASGLSLKSYGPARGRTWGSPACSKLSKTLLKSKW